MRIYLVVTVCVVLVHEAIGQNYPPFDGTCHYGGHNLHPGDSIKSLDGCNTCSCHNWGLGCTGDTNNHCYGPTFTTGTPACRYSLKDYHVGATFKVHDGCNTCHCTAKGVMTCTNSACVNSGFAKPVGHGYMADCLYDNKWYRLGDQFKNTDGCNTCVCLIPGNFQGYYACTGTKCTNTNHIVG